MKKLCKILCIVFLIQAFLPNVVKASFIQDINLLARILYLNPDLNDEIKSQLSQEVSNQISTEDIQNILQNLQYNSTFNDADLAAITNEGSAEAETWKACVSMAAETISTHYSAISSSNGSETGASDIPDWARGDNSTETIENHIQAFATYTSLMTFNPGFALVYASNYLSENFSGSASDRCAAGATPPQSSVSSEYQNPGMFSKEILINMQKMMEMIYKSLGQIYMLGHGLICFATDIAYTCVGMEDTWFGDLCALKIPNFGFMICGFIIYMVTFFLTMTIGMYFVDVSFKLGFAVLFLPISLAMWPFPPTKSKLTENLSIVIRNAMLFAFVAIGISYAVLLIKQGVIGNQSDWQEFWDVVDGGREEYESNIQYMSKRFSLDSTKVLVIIFCLIFGFKIISSSINDYLDNFFSDSTFRKDSPMHHMGTQAIAYAKSRTVDPFTDYVKDVATHQTGRAISAAGQSLGRMSQGDFSDIKNIGKGIKNVGSAIRHPGRTFNKLSSKVGETTNRAVQSLGNIVTEAYDTVNIIRHDSQTRAEKTEKFRARVNNLTEKVGETLQYGISNANVLRHPARTLARATIATGAIAQAATQAAANITKKLNHVKNAVLIDDEYERAVKNELQDSKIDNIVKAAEHDISRASTQLGAGMVKVGDKAAKYANEKAHQFKDAAIEKAKQGVTIATATALNVGGANVTPDQVRAGIRELRSKTKETLNQTGETLQAVGQMAKGIGKRVEERVTPFVSAIDDFTRPTETSLTPSKILHPLVYPSKTIKTIRQLAKKGIDEVKATNGNKEKAKLILKKGGQVVLRSTRATVQETTQATVSLAGKFLDGLGKAMQDNKKTKRDYWAERQQRDQEEEERRIDEAIANQTLIDD